MDIKLSKQHLLILFALILSLGVGCYIYFFQKNSIQKPASLVITSSSNSSALVENKLENIIVDIGGAVNNPGVYQVAPTSRLSDVLKLAGGLNSDASGKWLSRNLNLAQKLSDSEKIYIPFAWEVENAQDVILLESTSSENYHSPNNDKLTQDSSNDTEKKLATSGYLNVNQASQEELEELPGIGPAYAVKIIENRPFGSREELLTKTSIPESTIKKFENLIVYK
jgi:competence protein ComEA